MLSKIHYIIAFFVYSYYYNKSSWIMKINLVLMWQGHNRKLVKIQFLPTNFFLPNGQKPYSLTGWHLQVSPEKTSKIQIFYPSL